MLSNSCRRCRFDLRPRPGRPPGRPKAPAAPPRPRPPPPGRPAHRSPDRAPPPAPGPPPPGDRQPPPPPGRATAATGTGTTGTAAATAGRGATATGATAGAAATADRDRRPGRHFIGLGRGTAGTRATRTRAAVATGTTGTSALRAPRPAGPGATGGRARTWAALTTLSTLARRARGRGTAGGRGRAHAGRRRAERVVTRPGAGTRSPARGRRTGGGARPLAGAGTTLAAASLAATAAAGPPAGRSAPAAAVRPGGPTRRRGRWARWERWALRAGSAVPGSPPLGRPAPGACGTAGRGPGRPGAGAAAGARGGALSARGRSGRGRRRPRPAAAAAGALGSGALGDAAAGALAAGDGATGRGPGRACPLRVAVPAAVAVRPRGLPLRRTAAGPATRSARWAPFGAESFLEPAHDGRLDRRGRRTSRTHPFPGAWPSRSCSRHRTLSRVRIPGPSPLLSSTRPGRTGPKPDHSRRSGCRCAPGRRQPVVFIALCSSSAHRCLDLLSDRLPFLPCCPCYAQSRWASRPRSSAAAVFTEPRYSETWAEPRGPGTRRARTERPAALRQLEASLTRVQVRTPARQAARGVGNDHVPGHHQAEQAGLGRALPATHAGAHRRHASRRPIGRPGQFLRNSTAPARLRHRWIGPPAPRRGRRSRRDRQVRRPSRA